MKHTRKLVVLAVGVVGAAGLATAGWTYWSASGSGTATALVGTWKSDTTTAVVSSANPSVVGQSVTYTATVATAGSGTPTGNVAFHDGASPIAGCGGAAGVALNGSTATCTQTYLAVGSHSITARYLGDADFNPSAESAAITQVVDQASTATSLTVTGSPATYGAEDGVVFTSTVTASFGTPSGTIDIKQASTILCSISLPSTTCSPSATVLNASPTAYSVTAVYSGNASYLTSTSSARDLTVNKATPLISWPAPAAITYGAPLGAAQLNASTNTAGTFTYNPPAGTILPAGSSSLGVTFDPDDTTNYESAIAGVSSITVNKAPLTITASSASMTYGGTVPTITPSYSGFVNGEASAVLTTQPTCSTTAISTSAAGSTQASSCSGASAANYTISYMDGTVTISKASTGTSLTLSSASITYGDESSQTFAVAVSPQFGGTPTGAVTIKNAAITLCTIALPSTSCSLSDTQLTPGTYSAVTATYAGDTNFAASSSTPTASFTVVNGQLHISALTGLSTIQNTNNWRATATVIVQDAAGNPVGGVSVTGSWSPSSGGSANSCTTSPTGQCAMQTGNLSRTSQPSATWTVSNLSAANYTYDSSANANSSVTVNKP